VVFCEGLIPTQLDPRNFLKHVASFVRPGGVLVVTCMESISILSEVLRRYLSFYVADPSLPPRERLSPLLSFLKPHMLALPGMSRRHEDWVIDVILHGWSGPLFSIPEAVDTLHESFSVLGTSPHILTDWRWYKQITKQAVLSTKESIYSYWSNAHSLIDYRETFPTRDPDANIRLAACTDNIYSNIFAVEQKNISYPPTELATNLEEVVALLDQPDAKVTGSLLEIIRALKTFDLKNGWPELPQFTSYWGRGQQYISFIHEPPINNV
jgi:hypothetical protein